MIKIPKSAKIMNDGRVYINDVVHMQAFGFVLGEAGFKDGSWCYRESDYTLLRDLNNDEIVYTRVTRGDAVGDAVIYIKNN